MMFEIANRKANYKKVPFGKHNYKIGPRKVKVTEELFNILLGKEEFLFYKDNVLVNINKTKEDSTFVKGTIKEKKSLKKLINL
jgi:hypothetical protein